MIRILQRWLVGMTLPFVVRTVLVSGFGIDVPEFARVWKEFVIVIVGVWGLWLLVRQGGWRDRFLWTMIGVLTGLVVWSVVLAFGIHGQSLRERIVFAKYDVFPRLVLLVGYVVARVSGGYERLAKTMQTIISVLLVVGVARWAVSVWMPDVLVSMGWSMDAYQWSADAPPPVRYLTQVRWGYVRNGSIFGGPTSWGFFLVAFAPWYIARIIKKQEGTRRNRKAIFWIVLLVVNVGLTFSRAAWGAFAVEIVLICIVYFLSGSKKRTKKDQVKTAHTSFSQSASRTMLSSSLRRSFLLVGVGVLGVIATIGLIRLAGPVDVPQAADRDQGVFSRDLSDKGHMELLLEGINQVGLAPRVGYGVASVGPGAYRTDTADDAIYHPENQYIQILMEVGVVGFVLWIGLWATVGRSGINRHNRGNGDGVYMLLGVVGLAIVGLVLHSMMESMSIYPWMLMMGVWMGTRRSAD